jgi:hypothetical protein
MSHIRRLQRYASLPANTRQEARIASGPSARQPQSRMLSLIATPFAVVLTESVAEVLVVTHRPRTNAAPIATGRYRR